MVDEIAIRQYAPSDLERCRALWVELTESHRELYDDPTIGGNDPGLHFDEYLGRAGRERIWVAECEGHVVGCAGLLAGHDGMEVDPLVVAATHRGRGIGRALLDRMIEEARKLEVRYLSVKPVARNLEAISLYYECGLRMLGQIEMFMELQPSDSSTWKSGLELFGLVFEY